MSKDQHNKIAKVENLIWEIAKTLQPNIIIENSKIEEAKQSLLILFKE